jgi:hypothetical protein
MTENTIRAYIGGGQSTCNRTEARTVRPISTFLNKKETNKLPLVGESKQPNKYERQVLNTKLKYIYSNGAGEMYVFSESGNLL